MVSRLGGSGYLDNRVLITLCIKEQLSLRPQCEGTVHYGTWRIPRVGTDAVAHCHPSGNCP